MNARSENQSRHIYVTSRGLKQLQSRLAEQRARHEDICQQREVAHDLSGDGWHDNPHFNYLQQMEANSTWKVRELEDLISRARVVDVQDGRRPTARIRLGSVVSLALFNMKSGVEREQTYEIVGHQETDPDTGRISYDCPLGRALLGHRAGDVFELALPEGQVEVEIVELHPDRGPLE